MMRTRKGAYYLGDEKRNGIHEDYNTKNTKTKVYHQESMRIIATSRKASSVY